MFYADAELFSEPLIGYLENRGWVITESESDIAVLRKFFMGQEEEIVLPRDRTYVDYHQRILEAIQILAKQERISQEDILKDLLLQKWDILRIRTHGDRIGHGYLPYLDKGIIQEGITKVLLASARSISDPKPYFKRLYSSKAEQWMKRCIAGSDEPGSYIFTIQLPLQEDLENSEFPFSRKVAEYLMTSLHRVVELSEDEHSDVLLEEARSQLNANFCLGLSEMKPDENPIHFDFEMKWSSEIPVKKNIPTKIEIRDHHFSSIARIGHKLKPRVEVNQDVFIGKVLTLRGEADEQGKMHGEVALVLLIDEQNAKAKTFLEPEFYSIACDAHKQNQYVRISGILSEKLRYSDLEKVTSFEVVS